MQVHSAIDRRGHASGLTIGRTAPEAAGVGFEPTNDLDGHCRFSRPRRFRQPCRLAATGCQFERQSRQVGQLVASVVAVTDPVKAQVARCKSFVGGSMGFEEIGLAK
jgi:hypothetical protein